MVIIKKIKVNEEKAVYAYHPEGREDFGIISFDRKTKTPTLIKDAGRIWSVYQGHAFQRIKAYDENNDFHEEGLVAWY